MSEKLVFLNRRFIPESQASFSVFDRGLLYGDGLFETIRIEGGKFFRLAAHIRRLYDGMKFLGFKIPYSRPELEIFTRELAINNQISEGFARIVVSRGEGYLGFSPHGSGTPHVAICARERKVAIRGKEVWKLIPWNHAIVPIPIKSLSYLPHVLAKKWSEEKKCDDAILLDPKGVVLEATGSNLFMADIKSGTLTTPALSTGCLPGITRAEVIKVARKSGFKVVEKTFGIDALKKADTLFLTSSLLEIVPAYLARKPSAAAIAMLDELEAAYAYHRNTHSY